MYGVGFLVSGIVSGIIIIAKFLNLLSILIASTLIISFSVAGLLIIILASQIITCTLDKSVGSVTLKRQSKLGKKVIEYSIQEISDVLIEETKGDEGVASRVALVTTSGNKLPLTWFYTYADMEVKQRIVNGIREFLHLDQSFAG